MPVGRLHCEHQGACPPGCHRLRGRATAVRRMRPLTPPLPEQKSPPIEKLSPSSKRPRAFTQLVLTNLWAVRCSLPRPSHTRVAHVSDWPSLPRAGQVHGATVMARKPKKLRKICAALNLTVPDRELDHSVRLRAPLLPHTLLPVRSAIAAHPWRRGDRMRAKRCGRSCAGGCPCPKAPWARWCADSPAQWRRRPRASSAYVAAPTPDCGNSARAL